MSFTAGDAYADPTMGLDDTEIAAGDLDGDGTLDVIFPTNNNQGAGPNHLLVYLGKGDGLFRPALTINMGYVRIGRPRLLDVDSDGKLDLVTMASTYMNVNFFEDGLHVFHGRGDGTFAPFEKLPVPPLEQNDLPPSGVGYGISVADVNRDGHMDVVTAVYSYSIAGALFSTYLGDGKSFSFLSTLVVPHAVPSVALGDLDCDGAPDVIAGTNSGVLVMMGAGDGTWRPPNETVAAQTDPLSGGVTVADLDGDGALDVVAGTSNTTVSFQLYFGDGAGRLRPSTQPVFRMSRWPLAVSDLDGDGHLDIAAASDGFHPGTAIWRGIGGGDFAASIVVPGPLIGRGLIAADLNHDGRPDLILGSRAGAQSTSGAARRDVM